MTLHERIIRVAIAQREQALTNLAVLQAQFEEAVEKIADLEKRLADAAGK